MNKQCIVGTLYERPKNSIERGKNGEETANAPNRRGAIQSVNENGTKNRTYNTVNYNNIDYENQMDFLVM